MTSPVERTITIRRAGDSYTVTVSPPVEGFDFDLLDERETFVRTYARSLHRAHGWALRDEPMEGANG